MNRTEAKALCAEFDLGQNETYHELAPWRRVPASCARCTEPATRRICRDGEFLCDDHADARMNELTDVHGSAGSCGARWPWRYWLYGRLWWRPRNWLTYKQGPFRPFLVHRAWYRWVFGDQPG